MNIRPRNIPKFVGGGPATVNYTDPKSNWFTRSGDFGILEGTYNKLKPLYDKWKSSGSLEDYLAYKQAVDELNNDLRIGYAPGHLKYESNGNNLFIGNGTKNWQNTIINKYGFINDSIGNNFSKYHIVSSNPISRDRKGVWNPDNYWAGITNDRTTFGYLNDENNPLYQKWKLKFSEIGIDYKTGPNEWNTGNVLYGFLNENHFKNPSLNTPPSEDPNIIDGGQAIPEDVVILETDKSKKSEGINPTETKDKESLWSKLGAGLKNVAPDLLDALRLAGNMYNNDRVYREAKKAIIPNLQRSYNTYSQVTGDEGLKLSFYNKAIQGEARASRPVTSDMDKNISYMNEAKRIGDELRTLGDLADNQRIRETAEQSNAHLNANIERDTTIANANITELNKAKAALHQLNAQKSSADWTNIELFVMGKLSKLEQKKAKLEAIEDQIKTLQILSDLDNDPLLKEAMSEFNTLARELYPNGNIDYNDPKLAEAASKVKNTRRQALIKYYRLYAKSGAKLEYKDETNKYLYRTSKEIVEHFRKMSKMTDDSRVKTLPKPIKLTSHPKAKKYLLGGVAPFTIYRPLGAGGSSVVSTQTSSSDSSNKNKDKDKLDMIKELFKSIQGLPVDVSKVYGEILNTLNRAKAFGEELSSDDIASMYLSSINKIAKLKYSEESYKQAHAQAVANDALNEIAVGSNGELILQNQETGEVKRGTMQLALESKGKWNPLNNSLVLNMRALNPNLVFDDDIFNIVNNGVGISKIASEIKSLADKIGASTVKIEGISLVESNKVRAGLQILAGIDGTPDGYYLVTLSNKDSKEQVKAALNYIYSMLPKNYKVILGMHSGGEEQSRALIASFLSAQTSPSVELTIAPLTGKASKDDKNSLDKVSSNPLLAMLREIGGNYLNYSLVSKDSNTRLSVNGTFYSSLPKISEDMSIDKMLSTSGINGIIQGKRGITFGNLEIKPEDLKYIMYSDNGGMVATLPCKIVNGIKQVNLDIIDSYERAEQKALQVNNNRQSPEFILALALELKNEHLDSLLDSNGLPNKNMFGLFLIVEAYTSDKIKFDTNSKYIEKVENPDEELEQRISKALSTDAKKSNYDLDVKDHWILFEGSWDDIYRGTVFIPLNNNPNAALNSWGNSVKVGQTTELEEIYLISNKSSNFNKNNTLE